MFNPSAPNYEALQGQGIAWKAHWMVEKHYKADCPVSGHQKGDYVKEEHIGNLLLNGGGGVIWTRLKTLKPSTTTTGAATQAFSSANSRIGVGNSTAAAAVTQTDLQGASKKYNGMSAGYPAHTDGTSSSGARQIQFRAVYTTAQANFVWGEWGVFNSTVAAKRMLNRKAQSLGTKTSAAQWTFTVTLALN